jgi:hypothetical protein
MPTSDRDEYERELVRLLVVLLFAVPLLYVVSAAFPQQTEQVVDVCGSARVMWTELVRGGPATPEEVAWLLNRSLGQQPPFRWLLAPDLAPRLAVLAVWCLVAFGVLLWRQERRAD